MPRSGPGSVGRVGRRLGGIAIDWALAVGVSLAFFDYEEFATLLVFVVLQIVFIPTIGGSIGQRFVGLRTVALQGGWIGLWRPAVRTALLVLALPALVWDSDQRGFHDKVAGTVLIRS
ncbi:RDD family protein [Cryobacterium frigoriphilum]|uniref:RDD family protein n=1 Tax=Cryobacterium frigoriphilum TaxID=1259150 RepID=A0A4R9A026_9MICO|nr:RDD family protein [Cryobacterium frigoriphilum]TFD49671.1 RDD family protein [Cryobacterium frigoriphilum]